MAEERTAEQIAADAAAAQAEAAAEAARAAEAAEATRLAEAAAAEAAAKAKPAPAHTPDWRDDRLAKVTAQKKDLERQIAELKAAEAAKGGTPVDPELVRAQVRAEEQQRIAVTAFNEACNGVAIAGRQQWPDFDSHVGELNRLVDRNDPASLGQFNTFLAAAIETGDAPKLIYELGGNLSEASRLLALPPVKMAVELAKRATPDAGGKKNDISGATKPLRPIDGRTGTVEIDPTDPTRSDQLSTKAWMERRAKQVDERTGMARR